MSYYTRLYDFLAGATVRSQEFDDEFNAIQSGFSAVETRLQAAIQTPENTTQTLPAAASRINKILSFDASGNVSVTNDFTGSFSFSGSLSVGGAVACADPAAGNHAATKQWVQTLALSATIPVTPSDAGKVLGNNGTTVQWTATDSLFPSMTGNAGKVLGNNGTTVQWTATDSLFPSMTGNAGKVLGNNGTTVQWTAADSLFPSMTGNAGKFLSTDGTTRSWMRPVITITFDNRGDMRNLSGADLLAWVAVEGLGMFQHFVGSTDGPDDDETAFATASGYWLLICPSWDVVDAYTLAAEDYQDTRLNSAETRLTAAEVFASKMFRATSTQSTVSVSPNSSTTFTVAVTGAVVGASVIATPPSDPTQNEVTVSARVSAENTVRVYIGNADSSLTGGFAAGDWQVTVINK